MKPRLTIPILLKEARIFAERESTHPEPSIYGVTDGKAVGTYLEHKFQSTCATSTNSHRAILRKESISPKSMWISR